MNFFVFVFLWSIMKSCMPYRPPKKHDLAMQMYHTRDLMIDNDPVGY